MRRLVGLLPAAGRGTRLPGGGPKELAPLLLEEEVPICSFALAAMAAAAVRRVVVVVSPRKPELRETLGDGRRLGLEIEYAVQEEPRGLPDAVRAAAPRLRDCDVLFAMPDTVFLPAAALSVLESRHARTGVDIMLGAFPTDDPGRLAPVILDKDGNVLRILDKPGTPVRPNTWGAVVWSPRFTSFCCRFEADRRATGEGNLSAAIEAAVACGLTARGHIFGRGMFRDAGTPEGLASARQLLLEAPDAVRERLRGFWALQPDPPRQGDREPRALAPGRDCGGPCGALGKGARTRAGLDP